MPQITLKLFLALSNLIEALPEEAIKSSDLLVSRMLDANDAISAYKALPAPPTT